MADIVEDIHIPRPKLSKESAVIQIDNYELKSQEEKVYNARQAFLSGKTKNVEFRRSQLKNLMKMLDECKDAMLKAFEKDMKKPKFEASFAEIEFTKNEIQFILNNLSSWVKPEKRPKKIIEFFDELLVYSDPYGVVLVIGAWNYPVHLCLLPVAGAIAGGNCVVLKPSEVAGATSEFFETYLPRYLDKDCYPVITGDGRQTTQLLQHKFDYIFFTGSPTIGKIIHQAAAKTLTPTTLELGGKSPVYLDTSADLEMSVRRILWGKLFNAGQTCIAPDYVLLHPSLQDKFIKAATKVLSEFYGPDVSSSQDICRIINEKQFDRLVNLIQGSRIGLGGTFNKKDLFIEPTILIDVKLEDNVMKEEIFGPVLPLVKCENIYEAISYINSKEKPLAIYVFSKKKSEVNLFIENTSSGNVLVNDTIMHINVNSLPFGGVGNSGMGSYHGKDTFDTFVHKKGVMKRNFMGIIEKLQTVRYPPYSEKKSKMLKIMCQTRKYPFYWWMHWVPYGIVFILGILFSLLVTHFTGNL